MTYKTGTLALRDTWAENWLDYWASGKGVFTTTAKEDAAGYSGFIESLTLTYAAGSAVLNELSGNWQWCRDHIPGAQP